MPHYNCCRQRIAWWARSQSPTKSPGKWYKIQMLPLTRKVIRGKHSSQVEHLLCLQKDLFSFYHFQVGL